MNTFDHLTYDQQIARLTRAARSALRAYNLSDALLQPIAYVSNAVFKVTAAGQNYALRLHRPGHKRLEWIQAELLWLRALHRDTTLRVPRPVLAQDGASLTSATVDSLPQPLPVVLFGWLEGQFFRPSEISLQPVRQAGAFLAQLHTFATHFVPPAAFARPRLDWEGLLGDDSPYNPGEGASVFTPDQQAVFTAVAEQVRAVMNALGITPDTFGLIHTDFIPKNILFHDGQVGAIDFDDCAWGYYLYDLAPCLWLFKDEPRYPDLRAALCEGYNALRPLPLGYEEYLETLIAARHLASCRWLAANRHHPAVRERISDLLPRRVAELGRFLETGKLSGVGETF